MNYIFVVISIVMIIFLFGYFYFSLLIEALSKRDYNVESRKGYMKINHLYKNVNDEKIRTRLLKQDYMKYNSSFFTDFINNINEIEPNVSSKMIRDIILESDYLWDYIQDYDSSIKSEDEYIYFKPVVEKTKYIYRVEGIVNSPEKYLALAEPKQEYFDNLHIILNTFAMEKIKLFYKTLDVSMFLYVLDDDKFWQTKIKT